MLLWPLGLVLVGRMYAWKATHFFWNSQLVEIQVFNMDFVRICCNNHLTAFHFVKFGLSGQFANGNAKEPILCLINSLYCSFICILLFLTLIFIISFYLRLQVSPYSCFPNTLRYIIKLFIWDFFDILTQVFIAINTQNYFHFILNILVCLHLYFYSVLAILKSLF